MMSPRFLAKAFLLISSAVSAAPLKSHDALVRTGTGSSVDRPHVMPPTAQAEAPVTIEFLPSGSLQVLSKPTKKGPAAVFSKGRATSAALVAEHHSTNSSQSDHSTTSSQSQTTLSIAVRGGLAGMATGVLQVLFLMWIRTAMNHQYYYGGNLCDTMKLLYASGGLLRFYDGVGFALLQVPMARFGDTFAQSIVIAYYAMPGRNVHGFWAGVVVATIGACWRLCMAPLDTLKLTSQVHGAAAGKIFARRLRESGMQELWSGALAMFLVIWVGSVPWWTVYNTVLEYWPTPQTSNMRLVRNAFAGVVASMASDIASNWLRVLKVKRQASEEGSIGAEGYVADATDVIAKDGVMGFFFRGIWTKILSGAIQGAFFSVLWNVLLGHMTPSAAASTHAR